MLNMHTNDSYCPCLFAPPPLLQIQQAREPYRDSRNPKKPVIQDTQT